MIYGSVCSGIEAATVAWHPLGWKPAFFAEIDAYPSAVLEYHWPDVHNAGDFTNIEQGQYEAIDLLVGGTPCQSFSIAGLRGGLGDDRGNLALEYFKLAARLRPRWLLWENVPGVLSSHGGRDFGSILGAMAKLGYGYAYRTLDAQYFGVPQRRRRVFVVGYLGDWRRASAVLFERDSLLRHPAPSREAQEDIAGTVEAGIDRRRGNGMNPSQLCVAGTLTNKGKAAGSAINQDAENGLLVSHPLRASFDGSEDGTGRGTPMVVHGSQDPGVNDIANALSQNQGQENVLCFAENSRAEVRLEGGDGQTSGSLSAPGGKPGQGMPVVAEISSISCLDREYGALRQSSVSACKAFRIITPAYHGKASRPRNAQTRRDTKD